jgi:hypothetical protein
MGGWREAVRGLALVAIGLAIAGCTAMAGPAKIENYNGPADLAFPGLLNAADGPVQRRFIFQIHGINTHERDWGESLLSQIPPRGYKRAPPGAWMPAMLSTPKKLIDHPLPCDDHPNCTYASFGQYQKQVFTRSNPNEEVVVFTYFWGGDLWSITRPYLQPDIDANTNVSFPSTKKSTINAGIKANVVDTGLSDAAGYLSDLGEMEREGVESALCAMFADWVATDAARNVRPGHGCLERIYALKSPVNDRVEFDFLSHSLGSRMLFDVLSDRGPGASSEDAMGARTALANRTRTFFMAANQLPLLAVAGMSLGDPATSDQVSVNATDAKNLTARTLTAPSKSFFNLRKTGNDYVNKTPRTSKLAVVAFQDPDDLLGFKATDGIVDVSDLRFVDVLHRNANQYLFLLAWPQDAHDHELVQPNSRQMILCGADVAAGGKLTARRCPNGPKP